MKFFSIVALFSLMALVSGCGNSWRNDRCCNDYAKDCVVAQEGTMTQVPAPEAVVVQEVQPAAQVESDEDDLVEDDWMKPEDKK